MLRADQETSLTTLLDEINARRSETLVDRTAVESHEPRQIRHSSDRLSLRSHRFEQDPEILLLLGNIFLL